MNPWEKAPVPGKPREESTPFWTEAEVQRIAAACRPWLRDLFLVGCNTGLRISALLSLRWPDVVLQEGRLSLRAEADKGGKRRDLPLSAVALAILAHRRVAGDGSGLVFASDRTGKRVAPQTTYDSLKRALSRAGVEQLGHYNHAMRHTFISMALARGVPINIVRDWAGHASVTMTQKYAHTPPEESRRRMDGFSLGGSAEGGVTSAA